jgi:hypothetical protein
MGYDMSLYLTVTPAERYAEVADAMEVKFGTNFDGDDGTGVGYLSNGTTRWSNMTEDMIELSKQVPEVVISIQVEGEENAEWIEHYQNGRHYEEWRPNWTPAPFDASKLN